MDNIELKHKLISAREALESALSVSGMEEGEQSTTTQQVAQAIKHLNHAIDAEGTGLPLLMCSHDEESGLWHIKTHHQLNDLKKWLTALCGNVSSIKAMNEPHIPTCPDCIEKFKQERE